MSDPTRTHPPDPNNPTRTGTNEGFPEAADAIVAPPGYEFFGEIGSGGMGAVYRARDLDLGRDVAVKVLLPRYSPDSPTARRFLDEARITGRLQHPGIPPIYRVGTYPDGRPFLAMKLIGGRTLEDMLKDRTSPASTADAHSDFPHIATGMLDRLAAFLETGRFLAIFEHIAQALAYAHEQGVIHRDLKPANIMVGAFGEVQVMDWGIARSGDRRAEPTADHDGRPAATLDYSPAADHRTPSSDLTQAGAVLGTPAYMPPEQAIGAVDQIGKPSDVFGLGAILCQILTGKPPYAGADAESNRQLAARAKLDDAFARLDACGAEPELVALAKRCLAPEPADRPRDAGVVAEEVAALRADAERRARQAEMDRARAEVKSAEERKRRRVQYALALSVVGMLAVAGLAAWWADHVRSQRRADEAARESELKARQLITERDVAAALNEVQLLREQGWRQSDDPQRWAMTLTAARSALRRAESVLASGGPSDELIDRVATAAAELDQDDRDCSLIAELDRIADSNEIQLMFSFSLTDVASRQFAAAFRKRGIDLLAMPTSEAVARLKQHRHRHRLVSAVRAWQQSLPTWSQPGFEEIRLVAMPTAEAAVAGYPAVVAAGHEPFGLLERVARPNSPGDRLGRILKTITDDRFDRDWWDAVERHDHARLKQLVRSPELRRKSPRELSSLAHGLNSLSDTDTALDEFLNIALELYPGEYWAHFRKGCKALMRGTRLGVKDDELAEESRRHLTAALALRPTSALAHLATGMEFLEKQKNESAGLRWLESAAKADPKSPWPHIFRGMHLLQHEKWSEALPFVKEAVRVDPDTGYFMVSAAGLFMLSRGLYGQERGPEEVEVQRLVQELIALHPQHHGGHELLGKYLFQSGDYRAALASYRKARELRPAEDTAAVFFANEHKDLERKALWEAKLPAVLRGEMELTGNAETLELADYCAGFEKKFALATRFVAERIAADPAFFDNLPLVAKASGWALQAGLGHGTDADSEPLIVRERYRRLALEWLNEAGRRRGRAAVASMGFFIAASRNLAPTRDRAVLARLPSAERAGWEKLWATASSVLDKVGPSKPETAPPPRAK